MYPKIYQKVKLLKLFPLSILIGFLLQTFHIQTQGYPFCGMALSCTSLTDLIFIMNWNEYLIFHHLKKTLKTLQRNRPHLRLSLMKQMVGDPAF